MIDARTFLVCALSLALVACSSATRRVPTADEFRAEAEKQRVRTLTDFFSARSRLESVVFRFLQANLDLCGDRVTLASGFNALTRHEFPVGYQSAAVEAYGADEKLRVIYVSPGTPAIAAGLRAGDILLAVEDWKVPDGRTARAQFGQRLMSAASQRGSVTLLARQGATERTLTLAPMQVCDYGAQLIINDSINSIADGRRMVLTTGMMWFAQTDEELAGVVGHEMAHNILGHVNAERRTVATRLINDMIAAGLGVNSRGTFSDIATFAYGQTPEAEADELSLYLMARAGFPVGDVPNFWRRLESGQMGSIRPGLSASHPPTAARYVAMVNTVQEIQTKLQLGQPLVPRNASETGSDRPAVGERTGSATSN